MSKHVGRKQRWFQHDSRRYSSPLGRVFYEQNGWYAAIDYRTPAPSEAADRAPTWIAHSQRLGPFKRPRNAMVALEREATLLRNRYGKNVLIGDQLWAEV
jgi:hypothetical protein